MLPEEAVMKSGTLVVQGYSPEEFIAQKVSLK